MILGDSFKLVPRRFLVHVHAEADQGQMEVPEEKTHDNA